MKIEHFIWLMISVMSILIIFYIPKQQYRLALLSFLTIQAVAWSSSLVFVQFGLMSYPFREFPHATRAAFLPLYIFFPMIYTCFILLFPWGASRLKRIFHYFVFVSICTSFVYFFVNYTDIQRLGHTPHLWRYICIFVRFWVYCYVGRLYISWFAQRSNWRMDGEICISLKS